MKEIVVLSGKGGTGKTILVASFATLAEDKVMADCDVDAADLYLLLQPSIKKTEEFWSGKTAFIDKKFCTGCGVCEEVCRFGAIENFKVNPISCEGCGFCFHVCPEKTITMKDNLAGHWFISDTRYGPLVYARLGIAQENSGKLVAVVRQNARRLAEERGLSYIISDGPPGIGCPVISSLSGANLALLVTEPTLSGMHDLDRILGVCRHFGVPAVVCINKYDLNEENARQIEGLCQRQEVEVISRLPFDNVVTEALVQGLPVVEYSEDGIVGEIKALWHRVSTILARADN
ncbi:MAG: ATP-binding protein [Chloroflexi bacterium]|jgi:MinD superfamily P-loop ATPase|nr:ATP-binding protein [Chloroflexota bacterium]